MDFLTKLAITAVLDLISDRKAAKKAYPAIAKVYVKIEFLANLDQALLDEIQHQRAKESKK